MKLVVFASGKWTVLLAEQVIEVLTDFSSAKGPKKAMLSLLRESVPMSGPQEGNLTVCKILKPGSLKLAEFRKGSHPGTKVRVIWFYGDEEMGSEVVCVRAFEKNDWETPPSEIPAATTLRCVYFEAKQSGELQIETMPSPEEVKRDPRRKTRKVSGKRGKKR